MNIMIRIIVVGKLKNSCISGLAKDYFERINHSARCELIELKDSTVEKEGKAILEKIDDTVFVAALCIEGKQYSSEEFSKLINSNSLNFKNMVFVIGGPEGLSDKVKERANVKLSLSKMTYTHEMARVILLEQIYRAYSIINNLKYHK